MHISVPCACLLTPLGLRLWNLVGARNQTQIFYKSSKCHYLSVQQSSAYRSRSLLRLEHSLTGVVQDHQKTKIFTLQFKTAAKSQLWSNSENNVVVWVTIAWGAVLKGRSIKALYLPWLPCSSLLSAGVTGGSQCLWLCFFSKLSLLFPSSFPTKKDVMESSHPSKPVKCQFYRLQPNTINKHNSGFITFSLYQGKYQHNIIFFK